MKRVLYFLLYFAGTILLCDSRGTAQVDLSKASLSGDFTIVYRATLRRVPPKKPYKDLTEAQILVFRNVLRQHFADAGDQLSDAQLDRKLHIQLQGRKTAQEQSEDTTPIPLTLTLSGHHGSLLYEFRTEGNPTEIHSGIASAVSVSDGTQTFSRCYARNPFFITQGFHTDKMPYIPIFCAGYAGITFIKSLFANKSGSYTGQVLYPGLPEIIYLPATIQAVVTQGAPRFDQITLTNNGDPQLVWRLSKHVIFHSLWVPTQVDETAYIREAQGTVSPEWMCRCTLVSLRGTPVEVARFDKSYYLKKNMLVYAGTDAGKMIGFRYKPTNSLQAQAKEAALNEKKMALDAQNGLMNGRTSTGLCLFLALVFGVAGYSVWRRTRKTA